MEFQEVAVNINGNPNKPELRPLTNELSLHYIPKMAGSTPPLFNMHSDLGDT